MISPILEVALLNSSEVKSLSVSPNPASSNLISHDTQTITDNQSDGYIYTCSAFCIISICNSVICMLNKNTPRCTKGKAWSKAPISNVSYSYIRLKSVVSDGGHTCQSLLQSSTKEHLHENLFQTV